MGVAADPGAGTAVAVVPGVTVESGATVAGAVIVVGAGIGIGEEVGLAGGKASGQLRALVWEWRWEQGEQGRRSLFLASLQ